MHNHTFSRKLSFNERLYIAGERITPPATNQFFFDGIGDLDLKKWQKAVEIASQANPGSRLILKGYLGGSRWEAQKKPPRVREIDAGDWDGNSPDGVSFIHDLLPVRKGPTCEVVLVHGRTKRICFRTHHSVMDGRGTLTWAEDIFRVLRGEAPVGSDSLLTDFELARSYQPQPRIPFPHDNLAPTGESEGNEKGVIWRKMTFNGKFYHLLGQLSVLCAKEAWRFSDGKFRISMPIDMRPHKKGLRSTGNLTMPIYVDVEKDATPEDIIRQISRLVRNGEEAKMDRFDRVTQYIPLAVIVRYGARSIKQCHEKSLYRTSGLISNLGRIPLKVYSGGGFESKEFWAIPPSYDHIPFFMGINKNGKNSYSMAVAMPKMLATNGRLETFMNRIIQGLRSEETP